MRIHLRYQNRRIQRSLIAVSIVAGVVAWMANCADADENSSGATSQGSAGPSRIILSSAPPVGFSRYTTPEACGNIKPDSDSLHRAIAGTDFEPLSEVRRTILDCLVDVEGAILQYQSDIPDAEIKLEKAKNDREYFKDRSSPSTEIDQRKERLKDIDEQIQRLKTQDKDAADMQQPEVTAPILEEATDSEAEETSPAAQISDLESERSYHLRRIPDLEREVADYERDNASTTQALSDAQGLRDALAENVVMARRDDQTARGTLDRVDDRVHQLLTIDKENGIYKLILSVFFAILIGIVIFSFFKIAGQDQTVRQQIFAGDAGLQFITLFALVIAIILFGIINILEGRELSALLGGISGYILGRSGSIRSKNAGAETRSPPNSGPAENAATPDLQNSQENADLGNGREALSTGGARN
jgi:hypothetical protein